MSAHPFRVPADPRHLHACATCGLGPGHPRHDHPAAGNGRLRARDLRLERELIDLAARAAGRFDADGAGDDGGLWVSANARAWPGGVRDDLDTDREAIEEFADGANYLLWGIERVHAAFLAGDPDATDRYERWMRTLAKLVDLWHELHTLSA